MAKRYRVYMFVPATTVAEVEISDEILAKLEADGVDPREYVAVNAASPAWLCRDCAQHLNLGDAELADGEIGDVVEEIE